ncbi:hypothetical protein [Laspinema olomoucense]|uniref:hypothetical protein n=1 Tax=Laspinema olomoucense TaxID=3231600 RepID=UPI0021BABFCB|nr:hypothetical protein [Laspinema sp. D3c]MCT7992443.1 hypothetical protein [Laspinema sp. D3c]
MIASPKLSELTVIPRTWTFSRSPLPNSHPQQLSESPPTALQPRQFLRILQSQLIRATHPLAFIRHRRLRQNQQPVEQFLALRCRIDPDLTDPGFILFPQEDDKRYYARCDRLPITVGSGTYLTEMDTGCSMRSPCRLDQVASFAMDRAESHRGDWPMLRLKLNQSGS